MHVPSEPATETRLFLENLSQHRPHVDAFGNGVEMISMGTCERIISAQKPC